MLPLRLTTSATAKRVDSAECVGAKRQRVSTEHNGREMGLLSLHYFASEMARHRH
jgi:hypothetical protein